jgi:hypothetical protein
MAAGTQPVHTSRASGNVQTVSDFNQSVLEQMAVEVKRHGGRIVSQRCCTSFTSATDAIASEAAVWRKLCGTTSGGPADSKTSRRFGAI